MQSLKVYLNERLAAAAEEIFGAVEKMITEYKEEISRSKDLEINRLRLQLKLLKSGLFEWNLSTIKPHARLHSFLVNLHGCDFVFFPQIPGQVDALESSCSSQPIISTTIMLLSSNTISQFLQRRPLNPSTVRRTGAAAWSRSILNPHRWRRSSRRVTEISGWITMQSSLKVLNQT